MGRNIEVNLVLSARASRELDEVTGDDELVSGFVSEAVEEFVKRHEEAPRRGRKRAFFGTLVAANAVVAIGLGAWQARADGKNYRAADAQRAGFAQQLGDLKAQLALQRTVIEQQRVITQQATPPAAGPPATAVATR
jgi:hypothetical protein